MSFTVTVDVIDAHPKFRQAVSSTQRLKDSLVAYMDTEIVAKGGGDPTYKAETDAYMAALDAALVAYESGATGQDTFTLTQQEADVLYYEKVALDAEIAALEADPDIDDLEAVPQYKQMKLRQVYLEDVYQQLLTQGYVPTPAPVADFSGAPLTVTVGQTVNFTDLSTNSPTGWLWVFNGGVPNSSLQNPTVIYTTPGVYEVSLTASNAAGSDTETKTAYITVNAAPVIPVADFSADSTTIAAGGTVNFTDLSTNTPTSWAWTFTGGTPASSTDQNPSVVYDTAGTYEVSLVATNAAGSSAPETKTAYITVT